MLEISVKYKNPQEKEKMRTLWWLKEKWPSRANDKERSKSILRSNMAVGLPDWPCYQMSRSPCRIFIHVS